MSAQASDRALLVPVSVEALVVPVASVPPVSLAPRFEYFGRFRLGGFLGATPWQSDQEADSATALKPGIHIHWQLPAALMHGDQAPGRDVEFPPVPNRWLVLRVATAGDPSASTQAWVVQSDALGADATNATVARRDDGVYVATRIGRFDRYEQWTEPSPAPPGLATTPLTAVGPGHPTFAAFYPGCRNVFGFHDAVENVDQGTFLYLVVGWYTRREDDPLGPDKDPANRVAWRRDLRAQWLDASGIHEPAPMRTVCHGTLHGVEWRRGDQALGRMPETASYSVAVGNTAVEALAALVAAPAERGHLWEPLLAALQYDVLSNLDVRRGMPDLDAELHRRRFHAVGGGSEWMIRPIAETSAVTGGTASPPFPTDPEVATIFDTLVDTQRERDALERELLSMQAEYHAAWYRSERPRSREQSLLAGRLTDLAMKIQSTKDAVSTSERTIGELCGQLQAKGIEPRYELVSTPMPWFWRATDPAILVAAPGDPAAHRYESGERSVVCRVARQVVSALGVVVSGQSVSLTMPTWTLPLTRKTEHSMPFDEVAALFRESLLLDPARATTLAANAYNQIGAPPAADSPFVAELATRILTLQRDLRGFAGVRAGGGAVRLHYCPDEAMTSWQRRWDPLFLLWELEWAPAYDAGPPARDVTGPWSLHDNTEYRRAGAVSEAPKSEPRRYRGWAPLSLSLARQFQDRLRAAPGDVGRAFASWSFFTQSADGFTDALIMREHTLQLPPFRADGTIDQNLLSLFGAAAQWSPLGGDARFFPARSGHARLSGLVLVDGFGRKQTVIDTAAATAELRNVVTAETMRGDGQSAEWIALPPRIAQPARLLARWTSVRDEKTRQYRESNANPKTRPIAGWIVPNHLDQSLLVCDAYGHLLGELQKGTPRPVWSALPGSGDDATAARALADAPHLKGFVDGIVGRGNGALEGLLQLIDRVSLCITTPLATPAHGAGEIVGQPLALARASLTLEAWGRLATNQREADVELKQTGGIGAIAFPVRLGDVRKGTDGLIGCFAGSPDVRYSTIRPAFGAPDPGTGREYFARDSDIAVTVDGGRVDVTLLLDPRATVHVASGILPVVSLQLPGALVTEALERMEASLRVGPVLGAEEHFRIPVPDDITGSWTWVDLDRAREHPWAADPEVGKPETGQGVPAKPLRIRDGWLSFKRAEARPR